jgi:micrococcal nuclease
MTFSKKNLLFILIIFICLSYGCGLYYDYDNDSAGTYNNDKYDNSDTGYKNPGGNIIDYEKSNGSREETGDGSNAGEMDVGINNNINNNISNETKEASSSVALVVKEVIDGDTVILSDGSRVRLIGINTPEHGMYFYGEAKEALEIMVLGKNVTLEKDISEKDQYRRLLRYVHVDSLFVNLEMVKRGFANVYTYPPDVKYMDKFLEAERYARENNLGLWQKSDSTSVEIQVNYDAPGNDNTNLNGEYVMIKNTGKEIINIYGWTIKDSATSIYKFGRYLFKPGEVIYIFTGSGEDSEGKFYWGNTKPVWNNKHDTLYLRDSGGLLIEIFDY